MKLLVTPNFKIAANVTGAADASKVAILMPGRLDTKDYQNFISHSDYLSKMGFLVAAIDPPSTWDSPGELINYSTSSYLAAVNELISYFGNKPTLLLGHSRGGATASLASTNPAVAGLVLVNAAYGSPTPPDPSKLKDGVLVEHRDLPPGQIRTLERKRFELPINYFEDGKKYKPVKALQDFKGPKLLIIASGDEFTSVEAVKKIFESLVEPKLFLEVGGTHDYRLFPEVIQTVNEALGSFVKKYF